MPIFHKNDNKIAAILYSLNDVHCLVYQPIEKTVEYFYFPSPDLEIYDDEESYLNKTSVYFHNKFGLDCCSHQFLLQNTLILDENSQYSDMVVSLVDHDQLVLMT